LKLYFQKIITVFLLLFILSLHTVFAGEKQGIDGYYSITDFDIFEDVNGAYDFTTISSPAFAEEFQHFKQDVISLGISKSVYWVRFLLPLNDTSEKDAKQLLQLANPNISKIDLYIPVVNDANAADFYYIEKHVGAERHWAKRDVLDTNWVFAIPHQYVQGQYVFLKLESISALRLPILVWQENSFFKEVFIKNIGYGIFYGILIAMFLYNLFIVFVLRDKTYLFYVLYIFFMFIYQFDAHGHLKLWLNMEYSLYNAVFWFCLSAVFIFSTLFTASFLQIRADEAILSKFIKVLLAIAAVEALLGVFGYSIWSNQIARFLGIIEPLAFTALAIFRLHQGFKPAMFYLVAWGVLALGILAWILLPYRILAANILMFATASEAILLSLALSDRFKTLRLKERTLTRNVDYYRDLSLTDELTGLYNRRYLKKKMQQEISRAVQEDKNLALIVMDIDFFKKYNDAYGHWQGDQVLSRFSEVVLNILDGEQMAFRFGGEEFVVLLPDTRYEDAAVIAENIRSEFEAEEFTPVANSLVHVTISGGLSILKSSDTEENLFQRADKALYQAKTSGRNRVVFL
jgi:two-component system, sensor histidine kinase LadS